VNAVRVLAFVRRELAGVVHQPGLVVLLVLGPFLVLLLFGAGIRSSAPPVRTAVVATPGSVVADQARRYAEENPTRLEISEVTGDTDAALRRLRTDELDLVVAFPEDADAVLARGERPTVTFFHDYLDPVEADATVIAMRRVVDDLNAQVAAARLRGAQERVATVRDGVGRAAERVEAVRAAVEGGDPEELRIQLARLRGEVGALTGEVEPADGPAGDGEPTAGASVGDLADRVETLAARAGPGADEELARLVDELDELRGDLAEFAGVPAGLFVRPFQGVAERVVEGPVELRDYYVPAVLVLLVQHMTVTFLGLSFVRDGQLGTVDLLRVAPVTAGEVLLGKAVAYLLLTGVVTVVLLGLLVGGLDVPVRGDLRLLALTVAVLLLVSSAMGAVLALLARSVAQAVTGALLLLLANVFFSGFLLSVERFRSPVREVAALLPATSATALLREVLLRGDAPDATVLGILGLAAAALFAVAWLLLRQRLRPEGRPAGPVAGVMVSAVRRVVRRVGSRG